MKPSLIYVGNQLAVHGKTATTIDILSDLLKNEGHLVISTSSKKNKMLRLYNMIKTVHRYRKVTSHVLIDTYSTTNFWYAIIIGRLCEIHRLKYIPILHGGNLPQRWHTHPKVLKRYLNKAHRVVSPSDYLKHAFAKAGFHQTKVIPNSIELSHYPFLQRSMATCNLLWVRSLDAIYNPMMAIKALEIVQKTDPEATLTMVGPDKDGSMEGCKKYVQHKKLNVEFTGLLSKKEWIERSTTASIFLNTARFDNMPVSILEAMALGLPVISTRVGGIPHMIEDGVNGILVPSNDVEAMVIAIHGLLKKPDLVHKLSKNGIEFVRKYDWTVVKEQWNDLFYL